MKNFWLRMPVKKSLSYAFACVMGRDVLCSSMIVHRDVTSVTAEFGRHSVGTMNVYRFTWLEARPAAGKAGLYTLTLCTYARNGWDAVSGDRTYREMGYQKTVSSPETGVLYTRGEVIAALKAQEKKLLHRASATAHKPHSVDPAPRVLRALNVHRRAAARLTPVV